MFKRKRDDSDDDEPSFGRQILPVANLPEDFNGTPVDGQQYLFTVRRDARSLPHVTRVANPYESEEVLPVPSCEVVKPRHPALPSDAWRKLFEKRFKNFRKNVVQPVIDVQYTPKNENHRLTPDKRERDHWWAFIAGRPESDWNPPKKPKQIGASKKRRQFGKGMRGFSDGEDSDAVDESVPPQETWHINDDGEVELAVRVEPGVAAAQDAPAEGDQAVSSDNQLTSLENAEYAVREPTPSLMRHIDHRTSLHLLMYFTYWINVHIECPELRTSQVTETHARWIFALLSHVEDLISADDMSLLRNLARAVLALLKRLLQKRKPAEGNGVGARTGAEVMSERSCWMVLSAVADVWGQRDLWVDVETMLS